MATGDWKLFLIYYQHLPNRERLYIIKRFSAGLALAVSGRKSIIKEQQWITAT
jgi:hypothetical protein